MRLLAYPQDHSHSRQQERILGRSRYRQAGLTTATCTGEAKQMGIGKLAFHLGQLVRSPNEAAQRCMKRLAQTFTLEQHPVIVALRQQVALVQCHRLLECTSQQGVVASTLCRFCLGKGAFDLRDIEGKQASERHCTVCASTCRNWSAEGSAWRKRCSSVHRLAWAWASVVSGQSRKARWARACGAVRCSRR